MKIELTKDEVKVLRQIVLHSTIGGGLVDTVHDIKKELERNLKAEDLIEKKVIKPPGDQK